MENSHAQRGKGKMKGYPFICMTIGMFLCLGMAVAGCAFAPTAGITRDKETIPDEAPAVAQIEDFDPVMVDSVEQFVTTPEKISTRLARESDSKLSRNITEISKETSLVQGYRVQIFVSSDQVGAQRTMNEAEAFFPGEVYLQYDAPYHKVRVGNCLTRREAELLKEQVARHGYRDAWIVQSPVFTAKK